MKKGDVVLLKNKLKKPLYDVRNITTLKDMIEQSEKLFGDKPAFLIKDGKNPDYQPITYTEFKRDIDAFGTALVDLGCVRKTYSNYRRK